MDDSVIEASRLVKAFGAVGGDVAWQLGGFGAAFMALMSMFIVGRHTRGEEQSGRSELVGAAPVAREAPVTAALVVVVAAQVLLGVFVALTMIGFGVPQLPAADFSAAPLVWLALVAAALTALGMLAFRRRDLVT